MDGPYSQDRGYDQFGNRWVTAGSYVPNAALTPQSQSAVNAANNRLVASQYDTAGNQMQDAAGRTFTYDLENRQKNFNGTTATYSYDGEGRRVKNDDVVSNPFLILFPQIIEGIRFDASNIIKVVLVRIGLGEFDGRFGNVDHLDLITYIADLKREAAGITERVERPAMRIAADGPAVIALVEIRAGFLATGESNRDLFSVVIHDDQLRYGLADGFLFQF